MWRHSILQLGQRPPDCRPQAFSARRRLYAMGSAHQQFVIERIAQAPDRIRYGWLRHGQPTCGPCQVLFAHDCVEDPQQVQVKTEEAHADLRGGRKVYSRET